MERSHKQYSDDTSGDTSPAQGQEIILFIMGVGSKHFIDSFSNLLFEGE